MNDTLSIYSKNNTPFGITDNLYRSMGQKLKEIRLQASTSQTFVANNIYEINQSLISLIEAGRSYPSLKMVLAGYYAFSKESDLASFLEDDYILYTYYQKSRGMNMLYTLYPNALAFKETILRIAKRYPRYAFNIKEMIGLDEALKSQDEQKIEDVFNELVSSMKLIPEQVEINKAVVKQTVPRGRKKRNTTINVSISTKPNQNFMTTTSLSKTEEKEIPKMSNDEINEIILGLQELGVKKKEKIKEQNNEEEMLTTPAPPPLPVLDFDGTIPTPKQRFKMFQEVMQDNLNTLLSDLEKQIIKSSPINIEEMNFNNDQSLRDWFINELPNATYTELLALFHFWKERR